MDHLDQFSVGDFRCVLDEVEDVGAGTTVDSGNSVQQKASPGPNSSSGAAHIPHPLISIASFSPLAVLQID